MSAKKKTGFRRNVERQAGGTKTPWVAMGLGCLAGLGVTALASAAVSAALSAGLLTRESLGLWAPVGWALSLLANGAVVERSCAAAGVMGGLGAQLAQFALLYGLGLVLGCGGWGSSTFLFLGMIAICTGVKTLRKGKISKEA